MNRAFISLYLFIVISVVLVGWGLDRFWEKLAPAQTSSAEIADLLSVLQQQWQQLTPDERDDWLKAHQAKLQHRLSLLPLEDIARGPVADRLLAGDIVSVRSSHDTLSWYQRLGDTDRLLVLRAPDPDPDSSMIYSGLLVVFYLAIALVIFLWVWPLSRDLAKLEKQTRHLGMDGEEPPLTIASGSTVYPLANAFNKMARRIRELISSHKEMTYAVSHELRTPLARMKFALAMCESQDSPEQQSKTLASVRQDIAEMESLISSLLLYAGFEQSSGRLDMAAGHMKDMVNGLLVRLRRDKPDGLQIEVIDNTQGAVFHCEWKLMETALQNLIQNARRFAKQHIRIELKLVDDAYQLVVEDDGPGIAPADRERVFESFVRLYNEDATQASGFGLGLAIVRRILRWHGGEASVEQGELGGARMVLSWPVN